MSYMIKKKNRPWWQKDTNKIGISFAVVITIGLLSFAWAKNDVTNRRREIMQARRRMARAEYMDDDDE